ncbi:14276_t:CDS:2 [Entrophospora sp. SA101]|nr:14276_t:CDS:2 [Entrophospora sp. SA101]
MERLGQEVTEITKSKEKLVLEDMPDGYKIFVQGKFPNNSIPEPLPMNSHQSQNKGIGSTRTDVFVFEQDRFLPIANVARIMKKALPDNAKIAKEAKECVQECVSEFISFITTSDRCQQEKRKTINGEDILWAMQSLGFENYAEALKIYLAKYRETTKIERSSTTKDKDESTDDYGQKQQFFNVPENFIQDNHQS